MNISGLNHICYLLVLIFQPDLLKASIFYNWENENEDYRCNYFWLVKWQILQTSFRGVTLSQIENVMFMNVLSPCHLPQMVN